MSRNERKNRLNRRLYGAHWLAALAFCALSSCSYALLEHRLPQHPEEIRQETVQFSAPAVEEWVLPNGLGVVFLRDDEVPLVHGALYVRGGSLFEPEDLRGLAALSGSQIREGAPRGMSPEAFDLLLDSLGASISSSFSSEYGAIRFSSLSADFDQVFKLFCRLVREPGFDETRFSLAKKLSAESIERRKDDPTTMASIAFSRVLYAEGSPYTGVMTKESLGRIERQQLIDFHQRFVRPQGALLVLSGALAKEHLQQSIEQCFASWKSEGVSSTLSFPPVRYQHGRRIYVLERDFEQATVLIGHAGPPRLNSDLYAIDLFNLLFGSGSFESLLFQEIRSKLGLAYMVSGGLYSGPGPEAGVFRIYLGTENARVSEAIKAIEESLQQVRKEAPTSEEIASGKSGIERSFPFNFASATQITERKASLKLLGYPDNFDATYLQRIEKLGGSELLQVTKRWLHPEDLVIVIVGKVSAEAIEQEFGVQADVFRLSFDDDVHLLKKLPGGH